MGTLRETARLALEAGHVDLAAHWLDMARAEERTAPLAPETKNAELTPRVLGVSGLSGQRVGSFTNDRPPHGRDSTT